MKIHDKNEPRTHVTVYDRKARQSKTITVVGASVSETIERIKQAIQGNAATV